MPNPPFSPAVKGSLYVTAGAVCISFAPLFVRVVDVDPSAVAFYRLLWAGAALTGVALIQKVRIMPGRRILLLTAACAALFTGDLVCFHQSILYIGPGLATIVTNFQVFFLGLIGVFIFKERLGARLVLAIPLALGGLWLLLETDGAGTTPNMVAGLIIALLAAAFYAGYILTLRESQSSPQRLAAIPNMGLICLMGALFSAVVTLAQGQSLAVPSLYDHMMMILYGVGCQAFGWLILSKGLPYLPASRAGLLILLQPTLAFIWDVLFFSRPTGAAGYLGATLALAAIALGMSDKKSSAEEKQTTPAPSPAQE